jgi:hypothetical protein
VKRAFVLAALLCAQAARAAPCHAPDLVSALPPEGATGVPTNATLFAAYTASADYAGEEVLLIAGAGDPRPVPASFDRAQGLLSIVPPDGLAPGPYAVRWPGLRGVDTATPGIGREIHFTAGAQADQESPRFDGLGPVTWDFQRQRNDCTDDLEDRLVFDLALPEASDDGGRASLALVVFQTAGPGVTAPVPIFTGPLPQATARLTLPVSRAVGHVCFAALARDLTGKVSESTQRESCVETIAPPFFRGCSFGGRGESGWMMVALGLALLARRRGR